MCVICVSGGVVFSVHLGLNVVKGPVKVGDPIITDEKGIVLIS